ncbi:MAG TPA: ARMT1-like domain-containing protein, partial [Clostridia bacterium]|nr:ARMT1-like domain-containing protein [Clostridia bacterium]
MEIFLDCLPCMLRQALDASRMVTDRADVREKILDDALATVSRYRDYRCSPDLCRDIHRAVKAHTGVADPYAQIKRQNIEAALDLLPSLLDFVRAKQEDLYWALKVAATGNVMDSALYRGVYSADFIRRDLEAPFAVCDLAAFEDKLQNARRVVIIADNSGETVFDRVLIQRLRAPGTFYAVRSEPILNDATEAEAYASGLGEVAAVVSTGCDAPGAML